MHSGSCHCGEVAFQFEWELAELIRCNCSLCSKRHAIMATVPRSAFAVLQGSAFLTEYRWNTGVAKHFFCEKCGIYVYHQRRSDPNFLSVNACCIDGIAIDAYPLHRADGKSRSSDTAQTE
jgi:hypothetical protein